MTISGLSNVHHGEIANLRRKQDIPRNETNGVWPFGFFDNDFGHHHGRRGAWVFASLF